MGERVETDTVGVFHARVQLMELLVDIRAQCGDVELNTVGGSTVGLKFTTDIIILEVPAVDIFFLRKDGRSELIQAIMKMVERQLGASIASRQLRARHGGRNAGVKRLTPDGGRWEHEDSVIIMVL